MTEVAPELFWARLPLPYAGGHVNVWLIDEGETWTVVDCGLGGNDTRAHWQSLLDGPMGGRSVRLLIGTHGHSDHVGFAGPFCEMTGAAFALPRAEWFLAVARKAETAESLLSAALNFYVHNGWPEDECRKALERRAKSFGRYGPLPASFRRIADGQTLVLGGLRWSVTTSEGHSLEHAMLLASDESLLIAGDELMPVASPPIGVQMYEPEANPLAEYFDRLARLEAVKEEVLVLPSHGSPYRGLRRRIEQIRGHFAKRLAQTLEAARQPATAYEICRTVFRNSVARGNMTIAFGQTLSLVNLLLARGALIGEAPGDGGPMRYLAATPAAKLDELTVAGCACPEER
ncbi:MBL fold metallo-hydrolase [Roseitranquillus sediminis]|uniref:MBL fold metallo-hydrolase n=1 Tax=Roseitranquillus sediminis TaxID=2809051 RepID=UPI001D0C25C1|nr:MBL fold metallo-hydrolase [Roseitranquillus sediminis]MBM9594702.1 MBL fold metallo-hydrolase [Roseitranquillus sediminis]